MDELPRYDLGEPCDEFEQDPNQDEFVAGRCFCICGWDQESHGDGIL